MLRARRFAAPVMLLALGLAVAGSGCGHIDPALIDPSLLPENVTVLRLQMPAFEGAQIQGIRMWRRSELSDQFEPVSEIRFVGIVSEQGQEFLEYRLLDPAGNPLDLPLSATIERDGASAQVALWFLRFSLPGEFKASVFNAAGESALSAQGIAL